MKLQVALALLLVAAVTVGTDGARPLRLLRQYDAFTRYDAGDDSRASSTLYSQISGKDTYTPIVRDGSVLGGGTGLYGYRGTSAAARYFGGYFPQQAELALQRDNTTTPTTLTSQNRYDQAYRRYTSENPFNT